MYCLKVTESVANTYNDVTLTIEDIRIEENPDSGKLHVKVVSEVHGNMLEDEYEVTKQRLVSFAEKGTLVNGITVHGNTVELLTKCRSIYLMTYLIC